MAIRKFVDVPTEELIGKFICAPSLLREQPYGNPAQIKAFTRSQLTYVRLPRGEWDAKEKEWEVSPYVAPEGQEETKKCNKSSITFVFDTAEEAIALYSESMATRKRILNFRLEQLRLLDEQAEQGSLPIPSYLRK